MGNKKIVIGLVGESGSGKDTVANYLQEKYGATAMRFVDPIRETLSIYFEKISRQDQIWLALEFKKRFGEDILCRGLEKRIAAVDGMVVINGIRFREDSEFIRRYPDSYVIYITADQKLRWERTRGRNEKADDDISFENFQVMEGAETEVLIPEIGAQSDFTVINESTFEDLLKSVDEIMAKIRK